jgi:hypothetical protein
MMTEAVSSLNPRTGLWMNGFVAVRADDVDARMSAGVKPVPGKPAYGKRPLKHHVIDRDPSLRGMLPRGRRVDGARGTPAD